MAPLYVIFTAAMRTKAVRIGCFEQGVGLSIDLTTELIGKALLSGQREGC
jgi:hypothetical protein